MRILLFVLMLSLTVEATAVYPRQAESLRLSAAQEAAAPGAADPMQMAARELWPRESRATPARILAQAQPASSPAPTPRATPVEGADATLVDAASDVRVLRKGGADWAPAASGAALRVGDEIRTGMGKVRIALRGRGELRLPPNSHILLVDLSPDGQKVSIELKGGRVWNSVTPAAGQITYEVRTPDLLAGVRGTLFNVSIDAGKGSRVAVFEGRVAVSLGGKPEATGMLETERFVVVGADGSFLPPAPTDPAERREWDEWDQWALDIHQQISSRFVFGGAIIDSLAQQHAADSQRHAQIVDEANQKILANREGERLDAVRDALMKFCADTGRPPTEQEGLKALLANPGAPGWKGPYLTDAAALNDRWGSPLYYLLKKSPTSGNVYGEVISAGPNRIFSQGQTDDLKSLAPFYQTLNAKR